MKDHFKEHWPNYVVAAKGALFLATIVAFVGGGQ